MDLNERSFTMRASFITVGFSSPPFSELITSSSIESVLDGVIGLLDLKLILATLVDTGGGFLTETEFDNAADVDFEPVIDPDSLLADASGYCFGSKVYLYVSF